MVSITFQPSFSQSLQGNSNHSQQTQLSKTPAERERKDLNEKKKKKETRGWEGLLN